MKMRSCKLFLGIFLPSVLCTCAPDRQQIITVDVTKIYPESEYVLQEVAEVEYLPLETKDDFLIDYVRVLYMDDKEIFIGNRGGFFTYDRITGKALRSFNRQGNGGQEYPFILKLTYDRENEEIGILTPGNRVCVYHPQGGFKREFSVPMGTREMYQLDKCRLLIDREIDTLLRPFSVISQQDGSELDKIGVSIPSKIQRPVRVSPDGQIVMVMFIEQIQGSGNKFLLSNVSADTVFSYTLDGVITPVLVRTPSVQKMDPKIILLAGTDYGRFFFFNTEHFGDDPGIPAQKLAYDRHTGEIVAPHFTDAGYTTKKEVSLPVRNTAQITDGWLVIGIPADQLCEAYARGELQGRLQEVAAGIKEDDNPVLMLVRFKN